MTPYLAIVFLLRLLPKFTSKSNRKLLGTPEAKKSSYFCHACVMLESLL